MQTGGSFPYKRHRFRPSEEPPAAGPCRVLKPIFSKVVDEYSSKMHFVLIDIEESPEIAEAAGVNGTPTIQFFKKKAKVGEMGGVKMKKDYREFIEQHI